MTNKTGLRERSFLLSACVLGFLLFRFGPYVQPQSFDLVQHYLLVNEIMKHAEVMPDAYSRMGAMASYPPVAHWIAAVIGWIGGSGLVGITLASIASVYLSYLLIARLLGSTLAIVLNFAAFALLVPTHSQVGWEIAESFFYPQLVAGVLYFGILLWASREMGQWQQTAAFMAVGAFAMWIQPLVAIHILAAGCFLLAFQFIKRRKSRAPFRIPELAIFVVAGIGSLLIIVLNPGFAVMRTISVNNGGLEFGYNHIMAVACLCGAIALVNLWRRMSGHGGHTDMVLGSAGVAVMFLILVQFAAFKFHGDGSPYAVKKHMFLVLTLGVMNAVRIITGYLPAAKDQGFSRLAAPLVAGAMSLFVLRSFNTPVAPILHAMNYAEQAASMQIPEFAPGNTVDATSPLLLSNFITTLTSFEHPFDAQAIGWLQGKKIRDGARFVMIRRTPEIDKNCGERFAENPTYVVVGGACLD